MGASGGGCTGSGGWGFKVQGFGPNRKPGPAQNHPSSLRLHSPTHPPTHLPRPHLPPLTPNTESIIVLDTPEAVQSFTKTQVSGEREGGTPGSSWPAGSKVVAWGREGGPLWAAHQLWC